MSADNYLLVRRHPDGGWCHTMEFESGEPGPVPEGTASHRSAEAAVESAYREEAVGYYEYGIKLDADAAQTIRDVRNEADV